MSELPATALLIFGLLGWALSLYFGFFRFKQFVWTRHKVTYDQFTRQAHRRRALASKLQRLEQASKQGQGIQTRRRLVATAYLELLAESTFLLRQGIVTSEQGREWVASILNQLYEMPATVRQRLLEVNANLLFPYPELDFLLAQAATAPPHLQPSLDHLLQTPTS